MRTLLLTLMLLALALPAYAYTPHVGDRAENVSGWDAISDGVAHLDDYVGQWLFIDFWASWCGPCMGELPNMLAETRPWRKRGQLRLFSVSLDGEDTLSRMHDAIREFGIDYPVLYDGGGWQSVPAQEWEIHSIPATFLVNPAGEIVATNLRGETLGPALEFFIGYEGVYPPIGVRSSHVLSDDGSVTVALELSNPRHTPLEVEVDYVHTRYFWAEDDPEHEGRPVDREYIEPDEVEAEFAFAVEFGEFGDTVHRFTIPAVENTHSLSYYVYVLLPETEALLGGEGLWVTERGSLSLTE
jgi:thiol-disulfide isomerase/thioredoxin